MSTPRVRTVAALLAALALSALPAAAQNRRQGNRQDSGQDGQQAEGAQRSDRPRAERRRARESGARQQPEAQRAEPRQAQRNDNDTSQTERRPQALPRDENRGNGDVQRDRNRNPNRNDSRRQAVPRGDVRRDNDRNDGRRTDRNDWNRSNGPRDNSNRNRWDNGNRGRDRGRPYVARPSGPSYRYYNSPRRTYVVPYGYRPYGRRPGWSLNLYFGNPYAYRSGGYYDSGYNRGYLGGNYGYYAIPQGFAYGSLRIVDAPRDAQVFVDGYYAGVVDDYDGVFQRLNLEPGEHQLEVEPYPGAPPLSYDVYVEPGRTVTVHVRP
jgi:hypothetical protein